MTSTFYGRRINQSLLNRTKDRAGVPRSQKIEKQWVVGDDIARKGYGNYVYDPNPGAHGRYYQYKTPAGTKVVAEHPDDPCNPYRHFHAGEPKEGYPRSMDMQGERYGQIGGKHHYRYGGKK